jgi:16S rRNA A1518/A1519 N6-dimethyltransferase RsmA/KsgA/DIM1 with predicted DNA glycosylase/AP lyase activity
MTIFIVILFLIFVIIIIFAFPQFSPIPYFPSNTKDMDLILRALKIRKDQTIIDLGAGDGIVIFEAAKYAQQQNLNSHFIAIDINPILVFIMYIRRLLHPNRKNIKIVWGDMFNYKFKIQKSKIKMIIYLYISPWYIEKMVKILKKQFKKFSIVSYYYSIPSLHKIEKKAKGINSVFLYNVKLD